MPTANTYVAMLANGLSAKEATARYLAMIHSEAKHPLVEVIETAFPEAVREVEATTGRPWWWG